MKILRTALLSSYMFYYLQVQQACHPGNTLKDIIFQVDRCEDALYTKCSNVGYAASSVYGSVQIEIPEGRYTFRIEDKQYKPVRKNVSISNNSPTSIFYLYPPSGNCQ